MSALLLRVAKKSVFFPQRAVNFVLYRPEKSVTESQGCANTTRALNSRACGVRVFIITSFSQSLRRYVRNVVIPMHKVPLPSFGHV